MFILGITGGIGAGKSTVASIIRALGIQVIDADAIAHQLTSTPGPTTERIASELGDHLLDSEGALDRAGVASLAFSNKRFLDELSALIHQDVISAMDRILEEAKAGKVKAMALDVPIPVKRGFLDVCDQIWVVTADKSVRLARLERRGMDVAEAERRMGVQMTDEEYRALADHEIVNNAGLFELEKQVRKLLRDELRHRGIKIPGLAD